MILRVELRDSTEKLWEHALANCPEFSGVTQQGVIHALLRAYFLRHEAENIPDKVVARHPMFLRVERELGLCRGKLSRIAEEVIS